ncbi:MAG: putative glycoside hydrolase [Lachnospiraceae bacterium]
MKVKGIYLTAATAGNPETMETIIKRMDETELNAVVIDFKDDTGHLTCQVDSSLLNEVGTIHPYVEDMPGLLATLKEHGIYNIARVVAFRDPVLAEKKPEWSLKLADGTQYRDRQDLAWINPYKHEVWEYLVEVGKEAKKLGFDEVQFDYIRFSTDKGIQNVVYDEADTQGRSKTEIITEFVDYVYDQLVPEGLFVSADVFGAIINSRIDAESVGQNYAEMAAHLDYICPMLYPSHYGDGNFGIEHPDMQPYETMLAALQGSVSSLEPYQEEGVHQAAVRPWLQDFTASYLKNYIKYGPEEVRAQIQAVYDAGYDEWILWNAANNYSWGGLKTPEEALEEEAAIAESRKALEDEEEGLPVIEGPVPELSQMPTLPEEIAPAASVQDSDGNPVIVPQMQLN